MKASPSLFFSRRFYPIFFAQFGGALNDHIFKSALLVLIAFQLTNAPTQASTINNLAAIIFIFPYFILSYLAGQLADRSNKARMIQKNKIAEIIIAVLCLLAFASESLLFLLVVLLLTGAQSAMFGPNKYALLPQLLKEEDLVRANAHVASGTFIAVLTGTLIGALLAQTEKVWFWIGLTMLAISATGLFTARLIPETAVGDSSIKIEWNPITQFYKISRLAKKNQRVWLTILGLAWFWFVATAYLIQIPALVRFIGGGNESVVTLFLALFISGIGAGCLFSAWISGNKPELGIVPVALAGLGIAGMDFAFMPPQNPMTLLSAKEFLTSRQGLGASLSTFSIGLYVGAFSILFYTELQSQTRKKNRARMVALSNMLNALAMVIASLFAIVTISLLKLSLSGFLFLIAILNFIAAIVFFRKLTIETLRFLAFAITRCLYRIRCRGLATIPKSGAALLVCNHISYMDPVILAGSIRRPVRFLMDHEIYAIPVLNWFFRQAGAIPVCSPKQNRTIYRSAITLAAEALKNGEIVMIYPEGGISKSGNPKEFKRGFEKILHKQPATVYPMAIKGLWGSFFSQGNGPALKSLPKRPWYRVTLNVGEPIQAEHAKVDHVFNEVLRLYAGSVEETN